MGTVSDSSKYTISSLTSHTEGWDWEGSHVSDSYRDTSGAKRVTNNLSTSDIVEAGSVLICAGPADLDAAVATQGDTSSISTRGTLSLVPIGMVESAQISMSKQLNRIFEIGSKISYIVPGRMMGGLSLSRVFFDGPSLLKALYRGEVIEDDSDGKVKNASFSSSGSKSKETMEMIGSENIAMNLDSNFFDHPIGLAFIFRDQSSQNVGQIYFEGCYISSYGLGISASMNVLTESVSIEFIKCRPIVTGATTDAATGGLLTDRNLVTAQPTLNTGLEVIAKK